MTNEATAVYQAMNEIDTSNKFSVCLHGTSIAILGFATSPYKATVLTKNEALAFAAWLVALADNSEGNHRFSEILAAVQNS